MQFLLVAERSVTILAVGGGGGVLQWSAAVQWVSVIPVGRRTTEKTLREQIQRSGSSLMCNKQQLSTLFRGSLAGSHVY
jgi:hypothetical protein